MAGRLLRYSGHSGLCGNRCQAWSVSTRHSRINVLQCRHISAKRSATRIRRQPLEGITVVSLEQAIAAPYCTRHLADMGARVIKVERPGTGDFARDYDSRVRGLSSHFVWTNRSKESLALDLKHQSDLDILKKLLRKADVFVQNLAPGASGRLGLSYDHLSKDYPSLIVCDISGYGQDGPYSKKKAYDLLVQSEAGVLSVTGTSSEPVKVGIPVADISAGMYAYSNILAALFQRQKPGDGKGCHIDISMLETTVEWMGFPMYYTWDGAPALVPAGASHAAVYPYGPFDTGADNSSVMLGIQNEREWSKFCDIVLENPQLTNDPRFKTNSLRSENRKELKEFIIQAFSTLSADQTRARLDEAGIANAKVNKSQELWDHPQLKARSRWREAGTSAGTIPVLLPPGFHGTDVSCEKLDVKIDEVPAVGQHNDKILAELGISEQ